MGYFTPREKIDDLSKFNWVKLGKYLVGLDDINYKMYVFTPRDNFYTSLQPRQFLDCQQGKIYPYIRVNVRSYV